MPKTNISPGEALLFIFKHKPEKKLNLHSLYLRGVQSESDKALLDECLIQHSEFLKDNNFEVDEGMQARQKDGARRTYETLVAFESSLSYTPPTGQHGKLQSLLSIDEQDDIGLSNRELVRGLGNFSAVTLGNIFKANEIIAEYQNYLASSNDFLYEHTDSGHTKTLNLLIKDYITLFILGNRQLQNLPFNIYSQGMFIASNRGRSFKSNNRRNQSMGNGLVFSLFPPLPASPAIRSMPFTAEGNDNTAPKEGAAFSNLVKASKTGIFINSISGTLLVVIRALLGLHKQEKLTPGVYDDLNALTAHVAAMIDANLYIVGGHSYIEYFSH